MERVGGDEELFEEIAGVFIDEGPRELSNIERALEAGDAAALGKLAHSLKTSVGSFAATRAYEQAFALEQAGQSGDLEAAGTIVKTLVVEVNGLLKDLHAHLGDRPS